MVRLEPLTAMRWVRSVARNASRRSSGTRPVSPTTRAGNRARASGSRPSEAARRPARSFPANRWRRLGPPVTSGGPARVGRRTAAFGPPASSGGTSRPASRRRVVGNSSRHRSPSARSGTGTISSTGVRVLTAPPPAAATSTIRPSISREGGRPDSSPAVPPGCRTGRASPVTSTSAVTRARRSANSGTGPRWWSAPCSPAEAAPAAAQSRAAATQSLVRRGPGILPAARCAALRAPGTSGSSTPDRARPDPPGVPRAPDGPRCRGTRSARTPDRPRSRPPRRSRAQAGTPAAPHTPTATASQARPGSWPTSDAAAPHAATAGTASRRSTGPRSVPARPSAASVTPARRRTGPARPAPSAGPVPPPAAPRACRPVNSRRPPSPVPPVSPVPSTALGALLHPSTPLTAAPARAGPRSAGRRCRVRRGAGPPTGSRRSRCGGR
ncbi:hypothetical protein SDIAM103S_01712 [Streptomyces diastaticus subsp. diastaticus]